MAIASASFKLHAAIGKRCGGTDGACGGEMTSEETPADLGWPSTCPNFEHGDCTSQLEDCGDIAACIECVGEAATNQARALYYDDLVLVPGDKDLLACQKTIGKAATVLLATKSKALRKCWDARLSGKHANDCVLPSIGDGKYAATIAKARAKVVGRICKACGGPDLTCGGGNDLDPAEIGFPSSCPAVTVPGGAACGGPITDVPSLAECVECVTQFKVDCADRLQMPEFVPLPPECNVCAAPAPSGPCPTTLELTIDPNQNELNIGFTGMDHGQRLPSGARLTLGVSGCAGGSQPTCGQCNVGGPVDNAGGATFASRRCTDQSWLTCASDTDCTDAGASGPCAYFLGAPDPIGVGGIGVCIMNQIAGSVSGTVNPDDGSMQFTLPLARRSFLGPIAHPCPQCTSGTCDGGPRNGSPCTVQGTAGVFGAVSLDCPVSTGSPIAVVSFAASASSATTARTLTTANPLCSGVGDSRRCYCDTCNDAGSAPFHVCATDADCPVSGGYPGICGGFRCVAGSEPGTPCNMCFGGGNDGKECTSASACPGGTCHTVCADGGNCTRPGEPSRPNACVDDSSIPGDGTICQDAGDGRGECPELPHETVCSIESQRGCVSYKDCNPPSLGGECADCIPGQACIARARACFPGGGSIGEMVSVSGSAEPACEGVSFTTVDGLFCVPPSGLTSADAVGGFPGLGRMRLGGTVVWQ
jgi:hypothetical protein